MTPTRWLMENLFDRSTSEKGLVGEGEEGDYVPLTKGVWKEYANREPRFYASVAYNGAIWPGTSSKKEEFRNFQVWYYRGQEEGRTATSERWQPTGIGMMKYVNPKDNTKEDGYIYPKADPAIRYADILLMYAEALNEVGETSYSIPSWDGLKTYTITRSIPEMKAVITPIRIYGRVFLIMMILSRVEYMRVRIYYGKPLNGNDRLNYLLKISGIMI